jgi:Transposase DDE domain
MVLSAGQAPSLDGYGGETLQRLPLADAALALWSFVLQPLFLEGVFACYRGRSFEDTRTFPVFVEVIGDALRQHGGRGRQSFTRAQEQGTLPTSIEAVYAKLRRVPLSLSLGLLAESTARLRELLPAGHVATAVPASLHELTVIVGDGKTLKRVAKRLLPARGVAGKVFGGKLLVAFLPGPGLAVAMAADPDGEANEWRLVPQVLAQARQWVAGPRLWVLDRQFCDLVQTARCAQEGDHCLIRYQPKVHFHPDPHRPAQLSLDTQGRPVSEEWGWLGAADNPRRRYVRRVTLERVGEEAVVLVPDLLDAERSPAADLRTVYLARWGSERVFHQITAVFALQGVIGSTPQATVFQAAFCLVLYNMVQAVPSYIAAARPEPCPAETLSAEQIFYDVQRELTAVSVL